MMILRSVKILRIRPKSISFFMLFPDGVGFVDKDGAAVYDCASQSILIGQNDSNAIHLNKGKAYLQKLYDDLARR